MYRVTVDSDTYGYDQFSYPTKNEALTSLHRLISAGLKKDDGRGHRYTIEHCR
jgi:hypothetical protein